MDGPNFDILTRFLTSAPSRRRLLHALLGAGLGLGVAPLVDAVEAKKKRKHKKKRKKAKPNAFGCLEVGDACKNGDQCCSGMCDGKKGKRTCRAHDAGTCRQDASGVCREENPAIATCNNSTQCFCFRTTAGSNCCAEAFGPTLSQCADCQKDADCLALGLPAGTACAPVSEGHCAGICESGMGCMIPCGSELPEPPE